MEQRNYSNQNDIRPIEDLISGKKSPPDLYPPAFNPNEEQETAKKIRKQTRPQKQTSPQKASADPAEQKQQQQKQQPRFRPSPRPLSTEARPGLFADDHMRAQRIKDKITPEKKKPHRKLDLKSKAPFLWGALGFLFGIAFWHTVGFWNFVEDAVLQKPETTKLSRSVLNKQTAAQNNNRLVIRSNQPAKKVIVRSTITPANVRSCVNLIMNRKTGQTRSSRCQPGITFYKGTTPVRTTAYRTR